MSDINGRYGYSAKIELEFQFKQRIQEQSNEIEILKSICEGLRE